MFPHRNESFIDAIIENIKDQGIGIQWFLLSIVLPMAIGAIVTEGASIFAYGLFGFLLFATMVSAFVISMLYPKDRIIVLFFSGGLITVIWKVAAFSTPLGILIGFVPFITFLGTTYHHGRQKNPPVSLGTMLRHPAVYVVGMMMALLTTVSTAALLFEFPSIFSFITISALLLLKFLYVAND